MDIWHVLAAPNDGTIVGKLIHWGIALILVCVIPILAIFLVGGNFSGSTYSELGFTAFLFGYWYLLYKWAKYSFLAEKRFVLMQSLLKALLVEEESSPIERNATYRTDGNFNKYDRAVEKYVRHLQASKPTKHKFLTEAEMKIFIQEVG